MGNFVRKITGQEAAQKAAAANTKLQLDAQAQATQGQEAALQAQAQAAADSQSQAVARSAAEDAASKAASAPLETADVELSAANPDETVVQKRRATQASFGNNYGGVSI